MNLNLCIVSAMPELFEDAGEYALANATGTVHLYGAGNGCELFPEAERLAARHRRSPEQVFCGSGSKDNEGVPAALHRLWQLTKSQARETPENEVLVYIHDDVRVLEKGWDARVRAVFEKDPKCGLAGFGGSTALGGDEIYKAPYEVHQLGRRNFFSNMNGAELHGQRTTKEMPIVFTDGFSMIVRRSLLDKINGWSWWPFHLVHHAYDYGIACMARRHGYTGWLVPCEVEHRGGLTATTRIYQDLAKGHGGDAQVHADSHKFVYETFRDVLPLRLK